MQRALIVIDVQNEYFPGGHLPITHPVGHLDNILRVMDEARKRGVPTVVVQHTYAQPDAPFFRRATPEWQLHPAVAGRPHDHMIEKNYPGSFTGTDLAPWLQSRGIDTLTITGYMSHGCCDTTARQAYHRDLKVEFLSDATGTLALDNPGGRVTADEMHRSILVAQQMLFSEVLPTERWLERL